MSRQPKKKKKYCIRRRRPGVWLIIVLVSDAAAGDVSYRVHAPGAEPVALHLWLGKDAAARMLRAPLLETRLAQGDDWCIEEWARGPGGGDPVVAR